MLPGDDLPYCATRTAIRTAYSQVVFETNRYSVPVEEGGTQLVVKAYPFHLDILHQEKVIATHPRSYGREQDHFDPLHYLPLLAQRPGAFAHAKPIRRWRDSWPPVYTVLLERLRQQWPDGRGVREFIEILQLHQTYPAPSIAQAIDHALHSGGSHADGVRLCLHQLLHPMQPVAPLDVTDQPHLASVGAQPIALRTYDDLLQGAP